MCGRFSQANDKEEIKNEFPFIDQGFDDLVLTPRFNIAPSQDHTVIINDDGSYKIRMFRWGLIPSWSKDVKIGYRMINARAETIEEKNSFKKPFRKQRCLIPADGFYEWKRKERKTKIPYRFIMKDRSIFSFAGLWEKWDKESDPLYTFTIITTENNELMKPVHNRMPVILPEANRKIWLDPESNEAELKELLVPYDPGKMDCYRVSDTVNSWKNDVPECFDPVE